MFTFQKLAALIAVITAVLAAYRFLNSLEKATTSKKKPKTSWFKRGEKSKVPKPKVPAAERTIECQKCGTYFVAGTKPVCDDNQCPFPVRGNSNS